MAAITRIGRQQIGLKKPSVSLSARTSYGQNVSLALSFHRAGGDQVRISGHEPIQGLTIDALVDRGLEIRSLPAQCFVVDWAPSIGITFENPITIAA